LGGEKKLADQFVIRKRRFGAGTKRENILLLKVRVANIRIAGDDRLQDFFNLCR
jgi:hypothetical protein